VGLPGAQPLLILPGAALAGGSVRFVLRVEDGNADSSVRCTTNLNLNRRACRVGTCFLRSQLWSTACAYWKILELLQACGLGSPTAAPRLPAHAASQRERFLGAITLCDNRVQHQRADPLPCSYAVDWSPPPSPLSLNFSTSLCVVVHDDDTACSSSSVGLASPAVCLPLFVPAAQPRWSDASDARQAAANGTFPIFVGAVGCRSVFVAAAEDANYDVVVNPDLKLPPGLSLVSRQAKQPAHAAAILCTFVLT
jgi:hypothetical protein